MPTYYPINETLARQANMMSSYYEYKAGSATAEYRAMVDEASSGYLCPEAGGELQIRARSAEQINGQITMIF